MVGSDALQAIVYARGSLRLLDQRKLPLQVDYIDIKDSVDGCFNDTIAKLGLIKN